MVDVDGVVVHPNDSGGWAARIREDLGLDLQTLQSTFFAVHWQDIAHGRADLYERLTPVLAEIAPQVTAQAFVDYWFANDARLNDALLADLAALRAQGLPLHLATVQEHHRARYLWETVGFRDRFDAMHYAADLGCAKPAAEFFRAIEARTGFAPEDLMLIDDSPRNVEGARACGWRAALWDGSRSLAEVLENEPGAFGSVVRHDRLNRP
jgi:putative hydrolase of the HAD superfamily